MRKTNHPVCFFPTREPWGRMGAVPPLSNGKPPASPGGRPVCLNVQQIGQYVETHLAGVLAQQQVDWLAGFASAPPAAMAPAGCQPTAGEVLVAATCGSVLAREAMLDLTRGM